MTRSENSDHGFRHGERHALDRGVYDATDTLRLLNFHRDPADARQISRQTVGRWLKGYDYKVGDGTRHSGPLWRPDYGSGDGLGFEVSFRDLIELRFVKTFRDMGLSLQTIRLCFERATREVEDPRPFSTQKFHSDGRTIFLEITRNLDDPVLIDLRQRQTVFRTIVAPSFKDLEFDAGGVARWYPLGASSKAIVIDPARSFGRPVAGYGVPTEVIADAIRIERSADRVAHLYGLPLPVVRQAALFEQRLAA